MWVLRMRRKVRKWFEGLSFSGVARDIRGYTFAKAKGDVFAALSVGMLSLPQALAYAVVAGVPPSAGIIAVVLGTAIAACFCSSSCIVIGPNNATALLVQAALIEIFQKISVFSENDRCLATLQALASLTLLIGLFQLCTAIFRLGKLLQFVSHAVVMGYIVGTAFAISVTQLFPMVGLSCPTTLPSMYQKFIWWMCHLSESHGVTLLVGCASFALLVLLRRFRRKLPASLLMITLVSATVHLFGLSRFEDSQGQTLQLVTCGSFPGFESFALPYLDLQTINSLLPIAFAIALIGMLETNSIAKGIAAGKGQRIYANQEIFALGCANSVCSFFGALPSSASASRSAVNISSGANTRLSAVLSGGVVALFVGVFGSLLHYIPTASLAALLLATALRMIDWRQVLLCWRATRADAVVLLITISSCIFLSLPVAFYIGVILSIILYLQKAASPRVVEYVYHEETGELRQAREDEKKEPRPFRIINVEGELFFGAVDLFQHTLRATAEDDVATKGIILRLKHVHDLDASTALALKQLKEYLNKSGQFLILYGIPHHVWELLQNTRLVEHLGGENLIPFEEKAPQTALPRAIARARQLLADIVPAEEQGPILHTPP